MADLGLSLADALEQLAHAIRRNDGGVVPAPTPGAAVETPQQRAARLAAERQRRHRERRRGVTPSVTPPPTPTVTTVTLKPKSNAESNAQTVTPPPLHPPKDSKLASLLSAHDGKARNADRHAERDSDPDFAARRTALEMAGIFGDPLEELSVARLLRPSVIDEEARRLKREDKGPGVLILELRRQVQNAARLAQDAARRRQDTQARKDEQRRQDEASRLEQEAADARHRAVIEAADDDSLNAAVDRVLKPLGVRLETKTRERYSSIRQLAMDVRYSASVVRELENAGVTA